MAAARVYLDEDVHTFIAEALRLRGWQALTTAEAGHRGASDEEQIEFAASQGCAIITYNVRDFPRLHYEFLRDGKAHYGILVATQDEPGKTLRALLHLLRSVAAEDLRNQLVYLNAWAS